LLVLSFRLIVADCPARLKQHHVNIKREVLGGVTMYLVTLYILTVQPLYQAGEDLSGLWNQRAHKGSIGARY